MLAAIPAMTLFVALRADPWEGRYADYRYLSTIAMRLKRKSDIYVATGYRGGADGKSHVSDERLTGTFWPSTGKFRGELHYKPSGTSVLEGKWLESIRCFEITDHQGDATLTYSLKREN
jgi:hypothetical protein